MAVFHNGTMLYGLGIPLPHEYATRIELFRAEHMDWEFRQMRSEPHISIKGPAGVSESEVVLDILTDICHRTKPFTIQLTRPEIFQAEPIVYLGIESQGWWSLHRRLIDTLAARTGAVMHPWEIEGWIPHTTVLRLRPELCDQRDQILRAVERALSPPPIFVAHTLRMYRQNAPEQRWSRGLDFQLSG
jgi:2'-5' RNA ligase